jgi:hypothetical protein
VDLGDREQISVGDERRNHAARTDVTNDRFDVGMQQRLTAAQRDDAGAEIGELVDASPQVIEGDGIRSAIELVAVRAGEIAPPRWDDLRDNGPMRRLKGARECFGLAEPAFEPPKRPTYGRVEHHDPTVPSNNATGREKLLSPASFHGTPDGLRRLFGLRNCSR